MSAAAQPASTPASAPRRDELPWTPISELEAIWAWAKPEAEQKVAARALRIGPRDRLVVLAVEEGGCRRVEVLTYDELRVRLDGKVGAAGRFALACGPASDDVARAYAFKRIDELRFDSLRMGDIRLTETVSDAP